MRRLTTLLIAAVVALGGGCTAPRPQPVAGPSPSADSRCGLATIQLTTADGVRLSAIDRGSGPRGLVFLPELGRRGMCGWAAYAQTLAGDFHVLLIDHRCTGGSACASPANPNGLMEDAAAAVEYLKGAGVQSVVLIGASQGATEALIEGATAPQGVVGMVSISADELTTPLASAPFPVTGQAAASRVRLPAFFAVAASDPYVSVAQTRALADAVPVADKQVVEVSGSAHGWDLLDPPTSLNDRVRRFLDRVARPRLDGCVPANASVTSIPLSDGTSIDAASIGKGDRVVVLSNESDQNLCSWLDFAGQLTGFRVVLWDYAPSSPPDQLAALVAAERKAGARRIFLLGASKGAKTSLVAAAHIRPPVDGVVSLSAEATLAPGIDVAQQMPAVSSPVLLITAEDDPYGSADAAPALLAAAGSAHKRLVRVPGADHGTALLSGSSSGTVVRAVLAFLADPTAPSTR